MSKTQIDDYIAGKEAWARTLLTKLRQLILKANPKMEQEWKWRAPAFTHHGIVVLLWGFKAHVSLTFYHGNLLDDPKALFDDCGGNEHNRALNLRDGDKIPEKQILAWVKRASEINEKGLKPKAKKAAPKSKVVAVSADFDKELKKNKTVKEFFDSLSPSCKRAYTEWIDEAKREETKLKRIAKGIEVLKAKWKRPYSC
jgi:hypothetical protein